MTIDEQVKVMEKQLSSFDKALEKVMYLSMFFEPDPTFTKEARDIVMRHLKERLI